MPTLNLAAIFGPVLLGLKVVDYIYDLLFQSNFNCANLIMIFQGENKSDNSLI